jgi:protein dithiol:quinone oxidoreductase
MRFSTRTVFFLLATVSFGLLASGLVVGEWARLHPCYWCNFQRLLYMMLGVFGVCGVLIPGWRKLWCVLSGLTALGGVADALRQSWMQYAPEQVTECGFGDPTLIERLVDWLGMQWPAMFMVTGTCTSKEWLFLGLSLANWSGVCFLVLFVGTVWLLLRRETKR